MSERQRLADQAKLQRDGILAFKGTLWDKFEPDYPIKIAANDNEART